MRQKLSKTPGLELGTPIEKLIKEYFIELQPCFTLACYLRWSAEETNRSLGFVFYGRWKIKL
jgi:hypothetical protein